MNSMIVHAKYVYRNVTVTSLSIRSSTSKPRHTNPNVEKHRPAMAVPVAPGREPIVAAQLTVAFRAAREHRLACESATRASISQCSRSVPIS